MNADRGSGRPRRAARRLPPVVAAAVILAWPVTVAAHGMAGEQEPGGVSAAGRQGPAPTGTLTEQREEPHDGRPALLAVPYLAQEELQCGGAAAAMVLRYWGVRQAVTQYAHLVDPERHGIPVAELVEALRRDGRRAMPFSGSAGIVRDHLDGGRPVIALIEDGPDRYHYVVIVAWIDGQVVLHDPAVEPYRVLPQAEFERAWAATNNWSLLVLPGAQAAPVDGPAGPAGVEKPAVDDAVPGAIAPTPGRSDAARACELMIGPGIDAANAGDPVAAEARFRVALAACPGDAAPARELSGLRFRQERWQDAVRLGRRAMELEPDDPYARRLVASARFLAGDRDGALDDWNALQEPRVDLVDVRGLIRTRHPIVLRLVGLRSDELLTRERLVRARRRLSELPTARLTRLRYAPSGDGRATVVAAIVERPLLPTSPLPIAATVARAAVEREASLYLASPTGGGVAWAPWWRWGEGRSGVGLSVALPAPSGIGAVWSVDLHRQEEIFGLGASPPGGPAPSASTETFPLPADASPDVAIRPGVVQRTRVGLTIADWYGPDVRWEVGSGWDRWRRQGQHLFVTAGLERRLAGDRVAVRVDATAWAARAASDAFVEGGGSVTWRSATETTLAPTGWHGVAGIRAVGGDAPLDLRPGAGQGELREPLARAHPLVENGAIRPDGIGRSLIYGTLEHRRRLIRLGPVGVSAALFADVARIGRPASSLDPTHGSELQVDIGAGLRVRLPGQPGLLRLDLAHGLRDGATSFSTGWIIDWQR